MKLKLANRRCVLFARGCTEVESGSNIHRQVSLLNAFARRYALRVVGEVWLSDVSSMSNQAHVALNEILARKRETDDFDVLLMADLTRLSRGTICHTMQLIKRLFLCGISVLTLDNGLIDAALFETFRVRTNFQKRDRARRNRQLLTKISVKGEKEVNPDGAKEDTADVPTAVQTVRPRGRAAFRRGAEHVADDAGGRGHAKREE